MRTTVKARPARDHPGAKAQLTFGGAAASPGGGAGAAPAGKGLVWMTDSRGFNSSLKNGYVRLADCPEVMAGVDTIARLISSMPIHLMRNTEHGDVRVDSALADLVDIAPNRYMTRAMFIRWIVRTLYLDGRGNAVVFPRTEGGRLRELIPIPAAYVAFQPAGLWDYRIMIAGREYDPGQLLHFTLNPGAFYPWLGEGYTLSLSDVTANLKAAGETAYGFMRSEYKPSLIVKVDAIDGMDTPEGRRKILDGFVRSSEAGEPWLVPSEQVDVKEVRPLTLSDLALADFVKLDKTTVASLLGIPPFVLGVGDFQREAWNNLISSRVHSDALPIEQTFTRGLAEDPREFFKFSSRGLYSYDLKDLANIAGNLFVRGVMSGNEVRDWIGMTPLEGLDELKILENFIPLDRVGDQNKLTGGSDT